MDWLGRRWPLFLAVMLLLMIGCAKQQAVVRIYVDGTRGCKEEAHPVELWSKPGAVPAGASVVITVPHGVPLLAHETASAFGIKYYLVAWEGQIGWLPEIYTETMVPACE